MAERTILLTDLTEDQASAIDKKAAENAKKLEEEDIRSNPYAEGQKQVPSTTEHKQKVQQVVSKPATRKQETTADKIKKAFFGEEVVNVKDYVIFDIAIPALRATISDMLCGGIQAVFGGSSFKKKKGGGVDYASINRNRISSNRDREDRSFSSRNTPVDDILIETRAEAEEVLSQLADLAYDYGQASYADLYDLVGISANFTDEKYGWYKGDLRTATVRRVRDGYLLVLPRATRLD